MIRTAFLIIRLGQFSNLQFFQPPRPARKHRDFDLAFGQVHHLDHVLGGDGGSLEERSCHAAQGGAEGDALGDVEAVFEAA